MADAALQAAAERIAARAVPELEALVAVSSPSGDVRAAEEVVAVVRALLPDGAEVERPACSSPDHAPDLLARVTGTGRGRLLLLGHLDTVVAHAAHRPVERHGERLVGSGTCDMKGGDALALGVLRTLAADPAGFAELGLLLVVDEEWRTAPFAHAARFAGWDACLCFEAGELDDEGRHGVVVRRKAAGAVRVEAHGRASHSGSHPDRGRNALLALATVARDLAAHHAPDGEDHLTVVPTVMRSGGPINVVPAEGELLLDVRADRLEAFRRVLAAVPAERDEVRLVASAVREWPGMDTREIAAPVLERAAALAGIPVHGRARGGASDAAHLASAIPLTIDGLGPIGGAAHHPDEWLDLTTLRDRAAIALALARAALERA